MTVQPSPAEGVDWYAELRPRRPLIGRPPSLAIPAGARRFSKRSESKKKNVKEKGRNPTKKKMQRRRRRLDDVCSLHSFFIYFFISLFFILLSFQLPFPFNFLSFLSRFFFLCWVSLGSGKGCTLVGFRWLRRGFEWVRWDWVRMG